MSDSLEQAKTHTALPFETSPFGTNPTSQKVPELLAPAGGPEPFYAALNAGADAIYCALGNNFNARRSAKNFDEESFKAAAEAAHLRGVRVYLTLNIVIKEKELRDALALVARAWELGADAFIIQDWGLLQAVKYLWPQVEVHVSTQANIHDVRGLTWCKAFGASRVTLSREVTLKEIQEMATVGVELEEFAHGALCFCYSGACQLSSATGGRSANRGLCAQPCRLPYELVDKDRHRLAKTDWDRPLCPKDYCTIEVLDELTQAGVAALKLEGRMKAPDYVYSIVKSYRAQLDDLKKQHTPSPAEFKLRQTTLKRAFNRDFTHEYLAGRSDNSMMSYERSNNRGELVGLLTAVQELPAREVYVKGKNGGRTRKKVQRQANLTIKLTAHVGERDLLEVRPLHDPSQFLTVVAPRIAQAGETLVCRATRPLEIGSYVRVIRSQVAMDASERAAKAENLPKQKISLAAYAHTGKPLTIQLALSAAPEICVQVEGPLVEKARTKELTQDELISHASRFGNTPFEVTPNAITAEVSPGCGMSFSEIHKLRDKAATLLVQKILEPWHEPARHLELPNNWTQRIVREQESSIQTPASPHKSQVCALVMTAQNALEALQAGADVVYVYEDAACKAARLVGSSNQLTLWLSETSRAYNCKRQEELIDTFKISAAGNISQVVYAQNLGKQYEIKDSIPVHNTAALNVFESHGCTGIWLSQELSLPEIQKLGAHAQIPLGVRVLGRHQVMVSEHCILQAADTCIHNCTACKLRSEQTSLKDQNGALWPVRTTLDATSLLFSAHPLDLTEHTSELLQAGVTRFMADCSLCTPQQTRFYVERTRRALDCALAYKKPACALAGSTTGHLFMEIG